MQPICDKIWSNCTFYDTSMKFGTRIEYTITQIFGYRAISDFALDIFEFDLHRPSYHHFIK